VIVDLLVLGQISFAVWRGWKRGLTGELPSATSIGIFFVTGCGLFKWMYRVLSEVSTKTGQSLGVFTFVGLLVAAFVLWRKSKAQLTQFASRYVTEDRQRLAGAIAGGVRAFLIVSTLLLILAHWPLYGTTRWIAESSLLGRLLIRFILPVYARTHGAL
jgi:uncharacterized membrane protein required for colicin V production